MLIKIANNSYKSNFFYELNHVCYCEHSKRKKFEDDESSTDGGDDESSSEEPDDSTTEDEPTGAGNGLPWAMIVTIFIVFGKS